MFLLIFASFLTSEHNLYQEDIKYTMNVNDTFKVYLNVNPSTGYIYHIQSNNFIKEIKASYFNDEKEDGYVDQVFTFKVKKTGKFKLLFKQWRDKGTITAIHEIEITVK